MNMKALLELLENLPVSVLYGIALAIALATGALDTIMSRGVSFSLLYVIPILLVAWIAGSEPGVWMSIICTMIWLVSDLLSGHAGEQVLMQGWNAVMQLGVFLIITYSTAIVRKLLARENEYGRIDYLTGATNARHFYEQARLELTRSARYKRPFSIAYLDIDNFRFVNDNLGHTAGDYLLRTVVETMKTTLRSTDVVSRLGGDEFAILMPETQNPTAYVAINKVQERLLDMVRQNNWTVTFSVGVVTLYDPSCTLDELIQMADDLMHVVKENGKNNVIFKIVGQMPDVSPSLESVPDAKDLV